MKTVSGVGQKAVTVGVITEIAGWELEYHSHAQMQVMLSVDGVGLCEADGSVWLIPPQSAILIPAGVKHRVTVAGKIEGYAVFIPGEDKSSAHKKTSTINVTPLLRELIVRSATFAVDYAPKSVESRLMEVLADEIRAARKGGLHLPMPSDPQLRSIFQTIIANPSERGTIETWSKRAGLSQRTLARRIAAETGMSFGRWRQRLNIILALRWIATGATIESVAFDLGYENPGSFITMFRKAMGTSPARYVAERLDHS